MKAEELELELEKEVENEILFHAIEDEINSVDEVKTLNNNSNLANEKKKKKRKKFIAKLKKGLQIRTVLLLLLTLIVNTYAWFIYISTVSASISMHVKSWDFELSNGEQDKDFLFTVEQIYPGMAEAAQKITAKNNGEADAKLTCEIYYVKILDEIFETEKDYTDESGNIFQYTSQDLLNKILNDYPFKIEIYINNVLYDGTDEIMQTGASTDIVFKVNWAYEIGDTEDEIATNDEIDTYWGNKAYKYMQNNSEKYTIEVKLNIQAVQYNG